MPNRILKESICTSESIEALSAFEETMFYRLIVSCDDYGRFDARPKILASRLFPLKNVRESQIKDALRKMTSEELVTLYTVDGKPFGQMNSWDRHQQIRAKKSKYPAPSGNVAGKASAQKSSGDKMIPVDGNLRADDVNLISNDIKCDQVIANAPVIQSNPNTNPNTVCFNDVIGHSNAPTEIEVARYTKENGLNVNVQRFMAYYERTGWVVNGHPVTDWRAAVRYWATAGERPHSAANVAAAGGAGFEQRTYSEAEYAAQVVDLSQYLNMEAKAE